MNIRVLQVGLGPIGCAVARLIANHHRCELVGGVDLDPAKIGKDVGEIIGHEKPLNAPILADLTAALREMRPDIAVLCTSSSLSRVLPTIEAILAAKVAIVSTTEELAYPAPENAELARRINELARAAGVAVLGTGVNPGFAMDALPTMLTAACERVDSIEVDRVQDAGTRRLPFQQKIGAGLTPAEFAQKVESGGVRHVGLTESLHMIAAAMNWKLDRTTDEITPQIAGEAVSSQFLTVAPGQVCGLVQDGIGYRNGQAVIRLHMEAYLGAPESYEAVRIAGAPPLSMKIMGGVQGDIATAAMVVNSIPKVLGAAPGLHTMLSLPLPSYFNAE